MLKQNYEKYTQYESQKHTIHVEISALPIRKTAGTLQRPFDKYVPHM